MKWTDILIPTMREVPKDAEATSHKLMLRSGLIRKLSSGIYSYLPLGFRVLRKVIAIVREEMNTAGAQEVLLPAIHPAEIWKKTGRYDVLKNILMTIQKEQGQELVLGPTHEEIITELAAGYISSYKDLPITLYQIQAKFRDEPRPRFGVIRSKEFIMKDAYSFHASWEDLDRMYTIMYDTYKKIFDRCGLRYSIVSADSGDMGGDVSHEYMVQVPFGEDVIVTCDSCDLSVSVEIAECKNIMNEDIDKKEKIVPLEEFDTVNLKSIEDISQTFKISPQRMVKTLIYVADEKTIACLMRGDRDICENKLKKALKAKMVALADESVVERVTGAKLGFAGPVGLKGDIQLIADESIRDMKNFVAGANKNDKHIKNVNEGRDFSCDTYVDIGYVKEGDTCPRCSKGKIALSRSLEIGHIFKLGTKYSKDLQACFTDAEGNDHDCIMGCYGIGINRIMSACIELHSDEKGIIWPVSIAPFEVVITTVNQNQEQSAACADELYATLIQRGIDVLYDNRNARAGVKFNDADLIGIPYQIVIGDRNLKENNVELKVRADGSTKLIATDKIVDTIISIIQE